MSTIIYNKYRYIPRYIIRSKSKLEQKLAQLFLKEIKIQI